MSEDKLKVFSNRILQLEDMLTHFVIGFNAATRYEDQKQILAAIPGCVSDIEANIRYLQDALEQSLLHPCPFCHGAAELHMCDGGDHGGDYPEIECLECGCSMSFDEGTTKEEAIKIWNTRK